MSEIQRYGVEVNGLFTYQENGLYCHYADLLKFRKLYIFQVALNAVLLALLVYHNAFHSPVTIPMGAGEKASILRDVQAMQRARDDYKALALNYKAQIKALNAKADGHVAQLAALQARGHELDRINKVQAQRMSTHQGVVLEARRVLGVNVQVEER